MKIEKFYSRKFILIAFTFALVIANDLLELGLPKETIKELLLLALGYNVVEGGIDAVDRWARVQSTK